MEITLANGNAKAVVKSMGAEMTAYEKDGVAYIWGGDPESWGGSAPILFPNVCTLWENTARFGTGQTTLARHGFARRSEFTLLEQRGDRGVWELTANAATLKQYPFHFRLTVTHGLTEDGFSTEYAVYNQDDKPMPFCLGGHPGFLCPIGGQGSFEDHDLIFSHKETHDPLLINAQGFLAGERLPDALPDGQTLPLSYPLFDRDALIFDPLESRSVTLQNRRTARALRFDFARFPVLGVWTTTARNEPFVCLEPWAGLPDTDGYTGQFADKPHSITLEPGESYASGYAMTVL